MNAFVLGNGKSRLEIIPNDLKAFGKVYGCNRLYQEFAPDVLIAVDFDMAAEIQKFGYAQHHTFYTRSNSVQQGSGACCIPRYQNYSSGPVAVAMAALEGAHDIYLIGMDLGSTTDKINNVYAGTKHYKEADAEPTYYGNWVDQIVQITKDFSDRKFWHVNPVIEPEAFNRPNIKSMSLGAFKTLINK